VDTELVLEVEDKVGFSDEVVICEVNKVEELVDVMPGEDEDV
jgi:hypothetical protein